MIHRDKNNHITINMGAKYKKENKITPLYTLNLEVFLHYIILTLYDIVNDTQRQKVITSP